MMFMTPMPPMSSAMAQMPTDAAAMMAVRLSKVSWIDSLENISKSLSASGGTPRARRRIDTTSSWVRARRSGSAAWMVMLSDRRVP